MRILVTGATGFLGQSLVKQLVAEKYEITAIGRNRQKGQELEKLGANFVSVDLQYVEAYNRLADLGPHDALIHAAGLSSPWGEYSAFYRANVVATQTMISTARRLGCRRMIFISSPSVYFDFKDQIDIEETFPLPKPVNAYAATKRLAELDILQAKDLSPIILRPRAIYGRGDTVLLPRLVRAMKKGAIPLLRDGKAMTNLTYIDDCVEAVRLVLLASDSSAGRIFNIAGNEQLTIREIVEAVADKTGFKLHWKTLPLPLARIAVKLIELKAKLTFGQPEPTITTYGLGIFAYSQTLNCSHAKKYLGFEPKNSFVHGLNKVFDEVAK
ncbi:NAD-dependent epimerase/dehydratase family protein [Bartonella sp. LJL80]